MWNEYLKSTADLQKVIESNLEYYIYTMTFLYGGNTKQSSSRGP